MYDTVQLNPWAEITLVIISLLGFLFNTFVFKRVFAVGRYGLLEPDSILMVLIAGFDIVACGFAVVSQCLRWHGTLHHGNYPTWCYFDLLIFSTSTFATLALTSALSLIRYLVIVRGWRIDWKFSLKVAGGLLATMWCVVLTRGHVTPLQMMPSGLYCMPHQASSTTPEQIAMDVLLYSMALPFPFVIIVSYAMVTLFYHRLVEQGSRAALLQSDGLVYSPSMVKSAIAQFTKSHRVNSIKLGLVIVTYVLTIAPEYLCSLLELAGSYQRTPSLDSFCFLCLFSISLINPLFALIGRS